MIFSHVLYRLSYPPRKSLKCAAIMPHADCTVKRGFDGQIRHPAPSCSGGRPLTKSVLPGAPLPRVPPQRCPRRRPPRSPEGASQKRCLFRRTSVWCPGWQEPDRSCRQPAPMRRRHHKEAGPDPQYSRWLSGNPGRPLIQPREPLRRPERTFCREAARQDRDPLPPQRLAPPCCSR